MSIAIVCNSRSERGPLESVIAALPEARVVGLGRDEQCGVPPWVMARGLEHFADVLRGSSLVILLGDRYETLAAALAASFLRIPIAHIHGGEQTTGAFDDAFRDSITRLSTLHFVAHGKFRSRVAELQRDYYGIHVVGAPGLDGVEGNSATRTDRLILVTYHPETMAADYGVAGCKTMLKAIHDRARGYEVVFCGVNSDPGGPEIRKLIKEHCNGFGGRIEESVSHTEYVAYMQRAALVIGNSSAGIIEAPWVGCPSVNIGNRQQGRPLAPSVWSPRIDDIPSAIKSALCSTVPWQPVYTGGAAVKIAAVVREFVARRGAGC